MGRRDWHQPTITSAAQCRGCPRAPRLQVEAGRTCSEYEARQQCGGGVGNGDECNLAGPPSQAPRGYTARGSGSPGRILRSSSAMTRSAWSVALIIGPRRSHGLTVARLAGECVPAGSSSKFVKLPLALAGPSRAGAAGQRGLSARPGPGAVGGHWGPSHV
jgi:hypothetical protein